jgi:hypothetical protein
MDVMDKFQTSETPIVCNFAPCVRELMKHFSTPILKKKK